MQQPAPDCGVLVGRDRGYESNSRNAIRMRLRTPGHLEARWCSLDATPIIVALGTARAEPADAAPGPQRPAERSVCPGVDPDTRALAELLDRAGSSAPESLDPRSIGICPIPVRTVRPQRFHPGSSPAPRSRRRGQCRDLVAMKLSQSCCVVDEQGAGSGSTEAGHVQAADREHWEWRRSLWGVVGRRDPSIRSVHCSARPLDRLYSAWRW